MGNVCCRRVVVYSPNDAELVQNRCHQQKSSLPLQTQTMSNAYHNAGDDCAINELLEGRMDLDVIVPDGRQVRLTVERRTPMMDLLVQAASATKISPGSHMIHVFGDGGKGNPLQYKPSTPIGSLDTNTICIVPKKENLEPSYKRIPKVGNRPFEPTFRVQVHLPRNQLTVARVSPRVKISELRNMVCQEKSLDTNKYQLVRPTNPAHPLAGDMTLAEYGSTEITLLSNSSIESHIYNSTSHIIPYTKRVDEKKKKTGILALLAEDTNLKKTKAHVDTVDSIPAPITKIEEPIPPVRTKPKKRRPAPPPPSEAPSHSRQSSSDSSGYHDTTSSFYHDEQRRPTTLAVLEKASSDSSGVSSLDAGTKITTPTEPTPIQNVPTKKRKAPPPPAPPKTNLREKEDVLRDSGPDPKALPQSDCQQQQQQQQPEETEHDSPSQSPITLTENAVNVSVPEENSGIVNVPCVDEEISSGSVNITIVQEPKEEANFEVHYRQLEKEESLEESTIDCHLDEKEEVNEIPIVDSNKLTTEECEHNSSSQHQCIEKEEKKGQHREEINNEVTKLELATLNARIEQDVTQQEIASSIEAAFVAVSRKDRPSLLAIKQRTFESPAPSETLESPSSPVLEKPDVGEALVIDEEEPLPSYAATTKTLRRSSSLLSLADCKPKKSRSAKRSVSHLNVANKQEDFETEQKRLQREYAKLQKQFLLWQRQLISNHAMLREECILPYARANSLPEGDSPSPVMVSRSLSYEPDRSLTLPRSTINIPSLDCNSGSATLRSSKTKSHFKPPQIRAKSRQRLPPEMKRESEINDDLLANILPSLESLKLIKEATNEDVAASVVPRLDPPPLNGGHTNGTSCMTVEFSTRPLSRIPRTEELVDKGSIAFNSDEEDRKTLSNGSSSPDASLSSIQRVSPLPPPPAFSEPKPIFAGTRTCKNSLKLNGSANGIAKNGTETCKDPREELMLQIRKFGGRTALRKVSLAPCS